jgi:GNAT superfamily N-acetyltransferase
MFSWLRRFLRQSGQFELPQSCRRLPRCRFRCYRDSDLEACQAIYRLNEPGRFPDGYYTHFTEWLQTRRGLVLLCEADGELRGFGGMSASRSAWEGVVNLSFGMVHPEYHRQGFGSAILLARLAVLPSPPNFWHAFITTTGGSETFYRRFGFMRHGLVTDEDGVEFDSHRAQVSVRTKAACLKALSAAGIEWNLGKITIPPVPVLSPF